jgi:hypothetical protein
VRSPRLTDAGPDGCRRRNARTLAISEDERLWQIVIRTEFQTINTILNAARDGKDQHPRTTT